MGRSNDTPSRNPEETDSSGRAERRGSRAGPSGSSFIGIALVAEGGLAVVGWAAGVWSGVDWTHMVRGSEEAVLFGIGGGLGLVLCHLLLIVPGGARNPLYRTIYEPLREALRPPIREAGVGDLLLLALASGIGEEVFFRGWLQTQTGIVVASVLFGACHVWGRDALPYGLYATGMGVLLGVLFEQTGRLLWAPVLAHVVNNLLGFLALKYDWLPDVAS